MDEDDRLDRDFVAGRIQLWAGHLAGPGPVEGPYSDLDARLIKHPDPRLGSETLLARDDSLAPAPEDQIGPEASLQGDVTVLDSSWKLSDDACLPTLEEFDHLGFGTEPLTLGEVPGEDAITLEGKDEASLNPQQGLGLLQIRGRHLQSHRGREGSHEHRGQEDCSHENLLAEPRSARSACAREWVS